MSNQLELRIKRVNTKYKVDKKAVIQKVETPVVPTSNGFVPGYSTVDFLGCFAPDGTGIAFDAKETELETRFPLANIKSHQITYLDYFHMCGGCAFFLIHFKEVHKDSAFVTPISFITEFINQPDHRKSIPLTDFKSEWLTPIDDYLPNAITVWQNGTANVHT